MAGAPHLEAFLEAARYFIGLKESGDNTFKDPRGKEMLSLYGNIYYASAWCAVFISACAQKAGIAGTLIKKQSAAGWLQESTVLYCGGTWIDGPYINGGNAVTPMPGDIISFSYEKRYSGHGHASHVGIVEYVEDNKVHTIEGNTSNQCMRKEYSLGYSAINCYVRPDWSKVGDDISAYLSGQYTLGPLYQNRNDRHDMTLRQVGYLKDYQLSNNSSGIAISVINYTTALGDIYDTFAPALLSCSGPEINTSKLSGNIKIAVDYFVSMGFTGSTACALAGCLELYSQIDPTSKWKAPNTNNYFYGIGAWSINILDDIRVKLGDTWDTNLSGQLEYFIYDIATNYKPLFLVIKTQPLNENAVKHAVELIIKNYNKYFAANAYIELAQNHAVEIFNQLVILQPQMVGSLLNLVSRSGNKLSSQYSVSIPSTILQTGIIDDYTSYSAYFRTNSSVKTHWGRNTTQAKLAEIWYEQGFPNSRGIATIGGYYCVAVRPKFGKVGDVIVVTLEDSTSFPAIICDEKGNDAGSDWGHVKYSGKISIIEWERVKTKNGKTLTDGIGYSNVDKADFSDWYGKKVNSITNYGSYL